MNAEQNAELIECCKLMIDVSRNHEEVMIARIALACLTAPPVPVMKSVKLPKERLTSEFEDEFFDRRIYLKDEVKAALREAGIQIEGEE